MSCEMNSAFSTRHRWSKLGALTLAVWLPVSGIASAEDSGSTRTGSLQQQLNQLKTDESAQQEQVERDERAIRRLEQQLQQLETRHATLVHQADTLEVTSAKLKADTAQLQD